MVSFSKLSCMVCMYVCLMIFIERCGLPNWLVSISNGHPFVLGTLGSTLLYFNFPCMWGSPTPQLPENVALRYILYTQPSYADCMRIQWTPPNYSGIPIRLLFYPQNVFITILWIVGVHGFQVPSIPGPDLCAVQTHIRIQEPSNPNTDRPMFLLP